MNPARKHKLLKVSFLLAILALATLLIMYALRQNISLFFSPDQLVKGEAPLKRSIRVGGMVVPGSIQRSNKTLQIQFDITDYKNTIHVYYRGVLPDLFREGQGVVAQGRFNRKTQQFKAREILAKHDENYMPPEVKSALSATT